MILAAPILLMLAVPQEQEQPAPPKPPEVWKLLQEKYDTDQDGSISLEEHGRGEKAFQNLDRNQDGAITVEDMALPTNRRRRPPRGTTTPDTPRPKRLPAPMAGQVAPDFTLRLILREHDTDAGTKTEDKADAKVRKPKPPTVTLSEFIGKKPVALIFGSYT